MCVLCACANISDLTDQLEYEAILVTSVESASPLPPLLVFPHGNQCRYCVMMSLSHKLLSGGPHSAFSCEFQQDVVFMANLGFVVLMGM